MRVEVKITGHQGEGKSTLAETLKKFLKNRGCEVSIKEINMGKRRI